MLLQVPLPLLVVQVLAIDLALGVFPSLALIMEPPEPDVMKRPPRRLGSRLIDGPMLLRALYVGFMIAVGPLAPAFHTWMTAGWSFGQAAVSDPVVYARGTTIVMAGIIAGQLSNFFSARTSSRSVFRLSPLGNRWLFLGIFMQLAILATMVYAPFLQPLFRTASLSPTDWIILYSLAPIAPLVAEMRKIITKSMAKGPASPD